MPIGRARVIGINISIDDTVEGHCRTASKHHAQQNAQPNPESEKEGSRRQVMDR